MEAHDVVFLESNAVAPLRAISAQEQHDTILILRDEDILLKGIQLAVEIKFFATVIALCSGRQHLDNDGWIQQDIGVLVL